MSTNTVAAQAERLIRDGRPEDALAELQKVIRSKPDSAELRVFLSQLLMVLGEWKRAVAQLQTAAQLRPDVVPMAMTYRQAIVSEATRARIFTGQAAAELLGEPEPWMALHSAAVASLNQIPLSEELAKKFEEAFADAPWISGRINGEDFNWLGDSDSRLGPMFEFVVNGKYYWTSASNLSAVTFDAPTDLRDLVWFPAEISLRNGGTIAALMPTRYQGTESSSNAACKLSRRSEFAEAVPGLWIGAGQRVLVTDVAEYPLLEVRTIEFNAE
jgi:type VI secretion system protein ImpE